MSENDFQQKVLSQLAVLSTKMDLIIGTDGNGGAMNTLGARVTILEQAQKIDEGRSQISGKIIAALGGLAGAGVTVLFTAILHAFGFR